MAVGLTAETSDFGLRGRRDGAMGEGEEATDTGADGGEEETVAAAETASAEAAGRVVRCRFVVVTPQSLLSSALLALLALEYSSTSIAG